MAEIVEPPGKRGLQRIQPSLASMAALPRAGGEAENLDLDAAALERARKDIGAAGRHHDRAPAHRTRVVEKERDHGIAKLGVALLLVGQGVHRIDDDAGKPRRIDHALVEIEVPAAILLGEKPALKPVGESGDGAMKRDELLVEKSAQAIELVRLAQLLGIDDLVVGAGEHLVAEGLGVIENREIWPPRLRPARLLGLVGTV